MLYDISRPFFDTEGRGIDTWWRCIYFYGPSEWRFDSFCFFFFVGSPLSIFETAMISQQDGGTLFYSSAVSERFPRKLRSTFLIVDS